MNYIPLIEKAIEYLKSLKRNFSKTTLTSILRNQSITISYNLKSEIVLEIEANAMSPTFRMIERRTNFDHWIKSFPIDSSCEYLIQFLEQLIVFSRACKRCKSLGYKCQRINSISRKLEMGSIRLSLVDVERAHLVRSATCGKVFSFKDEDDIVKNVIQFEKECFSIDDVPSMPAELRELLIKGETE